MRKSLTRPVLDLSAPRSASLRIHTTIFVIKWEDGSTVARLLERERNLLPSKEDPVGGAPLPRSTLRSQPVSASDPIGVRGAVPSWPAVARCFKLCVSGPGCAGGPSVQLLPLPGHFPGRVARDKLGLDGSAEKGLPGCVC